MESVAAAFSEFWLTQRAGIEFCGFIIRKVRRQTQVAALHQIGEDQKSGLQSIMADPAVVYAENIIFNDLCAGLFYKLFIELYNGLSFSDQIAFSYVVVDLRVVGDHDIDFSSVQIPVDHLQMIADIVIVRFSRLSDKVADVENRCVGLTSGGVKG